jgi:CheY-like chemotaxis protein
MTVMYVEDNLSNVRLVEQVMTRRPGVSLMVAMQGRLALELALEHLPDLILLDLHLPDIQGDDVLRRLKDDPRTAPKPFDVSRLLAVIDTLGAPNRLHPTVKPIQDSQAV